jgi:segregation and condensation protein A
MARDRLGRDVFARGAPEGLHVDQGRRWQCDLFMLMQAYGQVKARTAPVVHGARPPGDDAGSALARVATMLGVTLDWMDLRAFLPAARPPGPIRNCAVRRWPPASSRAGTGQAGRAEIAQDEMFGPLMLRAAQSMEELPEDRADSPIDARGGSPTISFAPWKRPCSHPASR